MELNKDNFIESLSKLMYQKSTIKDQFLNDIIELTNIENKFSLSCYSDAEVVLKLYKEIDKRRDFIMDNLHSMFIQNEIKILQNIYKTIEIILNNIDIKYIEDYNLTKPKDVSETPFESKIVGTIVESKNGKEIEVYNYSEYYEKAIRLIEIKDKIKTYLDALENKTPTPERKGLTDHQTALFFHYIFKALEVQAKTDKTKMAGIILRLIGKEVDSNKVKDQNIYKMISNPIGFYQSNKDIESKTLQSNLAIIKDMFITLGIDTKEIQKDINSK
jgi:hypothetical protein